MIVGIDIGSGSLRALGCVYEEGVRFPVVVATYKKAIDGIDRGNITDSDEAANAIADAVATLEEESGHDTLHTLISLGATGLSSSHANGYAQVSRGDASVTDIDIDNAGKPLTKKNIDIIQRQDSIEITIHKNDGKTIVYKLNEIFNK